MIINPRFFVTALSNTVREELISENIEEEGPEDRDISSETIHTEDEETGTEPQPPQQPHSDAGTERAAQNGDQSRNSETPPSPIHGRSAHITPPAVIVEQDIVDESKVASSIVIRGDSGEGRVEYHVAGYLTKDEQGLKFAEVENLEKLRYPENVEQSENSEMTYHAQQNLISFHRQNSESYENHHNSELFIPNSSGSENLHDLQSTGPQSITSMLHQYHHYPPHENSVNQHENMPSNYSR